MSELPTGTVTFLFTDIEGSTRLLQELGDDFHRALEDHHDIMRAAARLEGGTEVSTEGDAFFIVFPSAPAAARAVVAMQRALAEHDWPQGVKVPVRMGLHTGEGILAGDNYGGLDVHRAARIAAAGHGGQVLMSGATWGLIQGAVEGSEAIDLGEHRLKDIERPERLFQLVAPGLRRDFPVPRTLSARPNNLLPQLTPFVGREQEVSDVRTCVSSNRLVTLTGPGGTGKTRLSLQAAADLLLDFADGAFFVPLGAVTDPALVASSIAQVLDVKEEGTRPVAESLAEFLSDKTMLLVLDNFEQIIDAAPVVNELLNTAVGVKVLVTSRESLRVSGEQEYPVPPMALPDPEYPTSADALAAYDAVDLFVQRAKAVQPSFVLGDDIAVDVARICARLDGLPLAIELAAARVRLLSPSEILTRLEKSLTFLTGGARDLPKRQQTLRDAIAWSYDLLDEPAKAMFRRLAVFQGGFDLDAVGAVCNPNAELGFDTIDGIESLIDKSLLRRFESDLGQTRFRMLVVIREFALEALNASVEASTIRVRHAGYFDALVEEAEPSLTTEGGWLDRLEIEIDNLREVFHYVNEAGDAERGLLMGARLWRFWHLRGHLSEGRRWMDQILALPAAGSPTEARAKALLARGSLAYWQSDFDETRRDYGEALEVFRALADKPGIAEALFNLGYLAAVERDFVTAIERHSEARSLHKELGNERGEAWAATGAGLAHALNRDNEEAKRLGEEAWAMFARLDDWFGEWNARYVVVQALRFSGRLEEALEAARGVAGGSFDRGDLSGLAGGLDGQADIEFHLGHHERAVVLAGAADRCKETIGGGAPETLIDIIDVRAEAAKIIGEAATEAAWQKGRDMSPEEARAFAAKDPTSM